MVSKERILFCFSIGKKGIYSDSERSTLHRVWAIEEGECAPKFGMVSFYKPGNFIC